MKAALVLTSIHDCTNLLDGYFSNFEKYGHDVDVFLIPDMKTPRQRPDKRIQVTEIAEQEEFLRKVGFDPDDIPKNSDNRRNVGYLMALASGAEIIVSIDDDNYCLPGTDFIGQHKAGLDGQQTITRVSGGWYNNCNLLRPLSRNGIAITTGIYPRGFPYYARNGQRTYHISKRGTQPAINSGLWIGEPDLDALTWLSLPYRSKSALGSVVLSSGTWCPINSQNTAIHRWVMPSYYFVRMEEPIDRFGDILQGYFAEKCAKHLGYSVRFGTPFVRHKRNSHNYLKDLLAEMHGIAMLEELLPALIEHELEGKTFPEAYLSLADFLDRQPHPFYRRTSRLMRQWVKSCKLIG